MLMIQKTGLIICGFVLSQGASVLRMLRAFLNDGVRGVSSIDGKLLGSSSDIQKDPAINTLRQYLQTNMFGNTEIEDLWGSFDNLIG